MVRTISVNTTRSIVEGILCIYIQLDGEILLKLQGKEVKDFDTMWKHAVGVYRNIKTLPKEK